MRVGSLRSQFHASVQQQKTSVYPTYNAENNSSILLTVRGTGVHCASSIHFNSNSSNKISSFRLLSAVQRLRTDNILLTQVAHSSCNCTTHNNTKCNLSCSRMLLAPQTDNIQAITHTNTRQR